MMTFLSIRARKYVMAAASLALGAGMLRTISVRADDAKTETAMPSMMTSADRKMMMGEIAKMKAMADQPDQAQKLKAHMAKMIVMDNMARDMALDPACKQGCKDAMADSNIKALHEEAEQMAADPQEMEKLEKEITADPVLMKVVMHRALTMSMMADMAPKSQDMNSKMKDMGDKMKEMGGKMLDGAK